MREAELLHEYLLNVLDYNPQKGVFRWKLALSPAVKVDQIAGSKDKDGYIVITIHRKLYKAGRLAWFYVHGRWPAGEIDHKNRIRSDNRLRNLRDVTVSANRRNKGVYSSNRSGHTGIGFHKQHGKWVARAYRNGKAHHIGLFDHKEAAIAARNQFLSSHL
ncbi:HNH endonuclease signature motif containing protein [Enterobacter asburiae]|uniref:HNH endonuclease signature motif containing protein n=1 Tax=Enterobacter asburiae TaxID=61645 RepID=UPI0028796771|nr:HNH endonuclease signature motif containing protein [Enterobacter asburiae]MDS1916106.1 HNH endonuclease signature motif containing protein [Enterobacter asburiae]